ncbi:DNA gyrase subunit A, partial [Candidatus Microgenomates bacterium]|nr:DNA gyrase subunit A [Candidatus Microgenomates bacterium]
MAENEMTKFGIVRAQPIVSLMEKSYLDYSMSVIVARALPDVRDGLKPVHRRILYAMAHEGLRHNAKHRKSANTVGVVMARYHPHGDQAIYDSLARMAQDFAMRYPLVDGQGNFGNMDGDPPAAMRYTEARMTALAEELLADIEKETVDFRPNFDGSEQEPTVLPAKVPNLLMNGQLGIAVGMATNIPPHNLGELIDALVFMIENDNVTTDDLLQFVKGPDFPTGGIVYGQESIRQAYGTGRGGMVVRAVAEVVESKRGHQIIITEMPYGVNKASLVERIAELHKEKKIIGLADLRDESARGSVRVVIELKKDAYPNKILNQLYKLTQMQITFHLNTLALVNGIQPRVLNLEGMLSEYLGHRKVVVRRRSEYELRKARERQHILEGLTTALDHIDEVIKTIRASQTTDDARTNLVKKFKLSELQANAILAMQLRTLAGLERKKIEDELAEINELIKTLEKILASEAEIMRLVKDELVDMKAKYADERRTKVVATELGRFTDEELIPNEQVVVTVTASNYIKRTPLSTYRTQGRGGKGIVGMGTKEEDVIEHLVYTNTHDPILFFTNRGRVFKLKAYELPVASRNAKGQAIVNLLQVQPDEKISALINLAQVDEATQYLFMTTRGGVVKKTPLTKYQNIRATGIVAIKLDPEDELRWVRVTNGDNEILISTQLGQGLRFNEAGVRPMGRATRGVRGIRLRPKDVVVGTDVVNDESEILVISAYGYGKRTKVKNFTLHGRGGLGIKTSVVTAKTGPVINALAVANAQQEVLVISAQGQLIRIPVKGIPVIGRATQGVRVMRLNDGDQAVSVALIDAVEEIEMAETAELKLKTKPAASPQRLPQTKT